MEKTLSLLVAATVLIMVSMTLIFSTTDSLSTFSDVADSDSQICNVLENDYLSAVEDDDEDAAEEAEERAQERGCEWPD